VDGGTEWVPFLLVSNTWVGNWELEGLGICDGSIAFPPGAGVTLDGILDLFGDATEKVGGAVPGMPCGFWNASLI